MSQATQVLKGWIELPKRRISQNLRFFRLRYFGERSHEPLSCQLVSRHDPQSPIYKKLEGLTAESCVAVTCRQTLRPERDRRGEAGSAGQFEYEIENLQILNKAAERLPFLPNLEQDVDPLVRAQHRQIELRSSRLGEALRSRARIRRQLQRSFEAQGFLEVETPLLFKSTPEGAREFVVPTRKRGQFFALPQSPQQYKQLLMAGGVHRYFQFARCFRDEDGRADRQPEFTQLDLEMGFASAEEVMAAVAEAVLAVDAPFNVTDWKQIPRMSYTETMTRFGSDKPDLRFGLEIQQLSSARKSQQDADSPLTMDLLSCKLRSQVSNRQLNELRDALRPYDVHLVAAKSDSREFELAKFLPGATVTMKLENGELALLSTRPTALRGGSTALGQARLVLQSWLERHALTDTPRTNDVLNLCWIVDFPLFSPSEDPNRPPGAIASTHHPFTAPHPDDVHLLATDPLKVRGLHYDLVLNGVEVGGGSARIHDPELQRSIFIDHLKMAPEEAARFDHLVRVLGSGCPPHAGFALGFDRFVATILGRDSIRDVLAFPKTSGGQDALVGSPSPVEHERLTEYHIKVVGHDKESSSGQA